MKFLFILLGMSSLVCADMNVHVGAHQAYTNIEFNSPNHIEGWLTGVDAGLDYSCGCLTYGVAFEGYWDIVPLSGNPCQRSRIEEYFVAGMVGLCIPSACCLDIRPHVGVGWNRFCNEQDPQVSGLRYRYTKIYIPVGLYLGWDINCATSIGLSAEWRPDIYSHVKVAGHNLDLKLKYGYRVELPFTFWLPCCWNIVVSPFFDWSQFGETTEKNELQVPIDVPTLRRWDLGLRASAVICF